MSQRENYQEAKKVLGQIRHTLDTEPLTAAQRNELETHAAKLAGAISHPWLPVSWSRRLIMVAIVILGVQQAIWADTISRWCGGCFFRSSRRASWGKAHTSSAYCRVFFVDGGGTVNENPLCGVCCGHAVVCSTFGQCRIGFWRSGSYYLLRYQYKCRARH
jgi:hypothetical protein